MMCSSDVMKSSRGVGDVKQVLYSKGYCSEVVSEVIVDVAEDVDVGV